MFLSDEFTPIIENLLNKYNQLDNMYYDENEKEYESLEEEIEKGTENIITEVVEQFNRHTEHDRNMMQDYYLEFYLDERIDKTELYIDENFVLYEDVSYTKNYLQ